MFLVLTADSRFQPEPSQEAMYLGQWCFPFKAKGGDSSPLKERKIIPYFHNQKDDSLYQTYQKVTQIYEKLLPQVAQKLNEIHSVQCSEKYWELIVGYWLREFLDILYERYLCVLEAKKSMEPQILTTLTLDEECYTCPEDELDFYHLYVRDLYNHQLFSQIISVVGGIQFQKKKIPSSAWQETSSDFQIPHSSFKKQAIKWACLLFSRWNKVFFSTTYLPVPLLLKVGAKFRSFPTIDTPRFVYKNTPWDRSLRAPLRNLKIETEFDKVIQESLHQNFPKIYIENFVSLKKTVRRFFPKRRMKLILTANSFAFNQGFKMFTAEQHERFKTPFAILQHGGNYGSSEWNSSEYYETRVSDHFLSYGWTDKGKPHITPFVASRIARTPDSETYGDPFGEILWVLTTFPRYSYIMYSIPMGPQFQDFLEDQVDFIQRLSPETQRLITCRPAPYEYGWYVVDQIQQRVGNLKVDADSSMRTLLKKTRIFVCTNNGTAHLESMEANVPTLLVWNPKHWRLRESARPIHDKLYRLGILHYDNASAVKKIEEIKEDAFGWWRTPEIQAVRNEFCAQFVETSKNPVRDWAEMIRKLSHHEVNQV